MRRGGIQQRIARAEQLARPELESELAAWLTEQVLWGIFSPQVAQQIAMFACNDIEKVRSSNGTLPKLLQLSRLGSAGKYPNHCHRDFLEANTGQTLLYPSFEFEVELAEPVGKTTQEILLPHEMFSAIYHSYPCTWNKLMVDGGEDALEEFWSTQDEHPTMQNNPIKERANYKRKCIPLALHGDEVPVVGKGKVWSKSVLTFEWLSLCGTGATTSTLFWIWSCFEKLVVEGAGGTLETVFQLLKWSFTCLFNGTWPSRNHQGKRYRSDSVEGIRAGTPLAGGYFAVLYSILGDLDYFYKTLKLPRYSSAAPCSLCKCTLHGPSTWKDFRLTAPWLQQLWKPLEWAAWANRSKCSLFDIPGVSICSVALDYMHCKYLGCDQYLFGSLLYILCFIVLPETPKLNLAFCWQFIKKYQKDHHARVRYRYLNKLSMFVRKKGARLDYPKLRGKAAEIKYVGAALANLWQKKMDQTDDVHRKINLLMKCNLKMEEIMNRNKHRHNIPKRSADELVSAAFTMGQLHLSLCEHFLDDENHKLFNVTSKSHMVLHCVLTSMYINPARTWCFAGEDFMRKVQKLGESCCRGVDGGQAANKMVAHYRLALHHTFKKFEAPN